MNQKKQGKKLNKLVVIYLLGLAIFLIIAGSYYIPEKADVLALRSGLRSLENTSLGWRFQSRAAGKAAAVGGTLRTQTRKGIFTKLIIASVDDQTIAEAGSLTLDPKMWANMLSNFNTKSIDTMPSAVLFDLPTFNEPSPYTNSDKLFGESIKNFKTSVGIGIKLEPTADEKETAREIQDYDSPKVQAMRRFEIHIPSNIKLLPQAKAELIQPSIAEGLSFSGTINMSKDSDVYEKLPLVSSASYYIKNNDKIIITNVYYPSALLSMSAKLLNSDIKNVRFEEGKVVIGNAVYQGKKGDFTIPVDNEYRMMVNYKAVENTGYLKVISASDIARAGLPRNSIILVGTYVQGISQNRWVSPLGSLMSTDHLAYALATIMNRDFILDVPAWLNILYVLILAGLIGFLVSKGIRTTIIAAALSIVVPLALGFVLFLFNINILMLIPLTISVLILISGEVYVLLTEEREKRFIKSTFSKYVNPELVNILIQNPDMLQLGGQDKDATILFSDIRGFTTLSEGMTPNELISFLNIYLSRMTDIVMETQGTLDKYIGDAVVAFWGTPMELPNHALNACKAAVKMIESLHQFNDEQVKLGRKPINIGVGLNSGNITVGNVGSDKKKNYTAIGENTQLAEDLQDENKVYKTNVIISEFTYERVKNDVVVRELGFFNVKGGEKPVRIYELIDMKKWD